MIVIHRNSSDVVSVYQTNTELLKPVVSNNDCGSSGCVDEQLSMVIAYIKINSQYDKIYSVMQILN